MSQSNPSNPSNPPPVHPGWFRQLRQHWRDTAPPNSPIYRNWRRQFLRQRLALAIKLAILSYFTFTVLNFILTTLSIVQHPPSWFVVAIATQLGLVLCFLVLNSNWGRRNPEWVFLATSWLITLTEQVWGTMRGQAVVGVFAWTLTFLTQATLMPVYWWLHALSQAGVLLYFFVVSSILQLPSRDGSFWDASLWLYLFWFCAICNLSVFLYERLQRVEFHIRLDLEAEQRKSERLLLNILPVAVAEKLKREQRTIADHFPEVTVLFADIVGFTQLSAAIPPAEMVDYLNQIFSAFDYLAAANNLEKIKTIGDAYMVVGGLPEERDDHVQAIANMALGMREALTEFNDRYDQSLKMRIGIHTGPVVAGVIGVRKFIYDLWGDTVNIASRMESHGVADGIQVSEAVYTRLRHDYDLEPRGVISVKGKGEMMTYLLKGKRKTVRQMLEW